MFQSKITRVRFSDRSEFPVDKAWEEVDRRHGEVPTALEVEGSFWTFVKNCFPFTYFEKTGDRYLLTKIAAGSKEYSIYRPGFDPYEQGEKS